MSPSARAARAAAYENPRPDIQALVPPGARRVLDLGCASGALGAALRARGDVAVVGIERDPDYAADAAARLHHVLVADLEAFDGWDELGTFDVVIAGDVLEHLRDPWAVLRRASAVLDPGGLAIVSLPNVRYWETFWILARHNTWPRRSEGIFDGTHLRWFTLRDAWALLDQAGLETVEVRRQMRLRGRGSRWDGIVGRLSRVPGRSFLTFQHVLVGRRR
ncbi:MAG: wbbL 5 [Solirubrobacterales bacterium]|nr:wbbL 5 [Solirubrobacterales bacterium]